MLQRLSEMLTLMSCALRSRRRTRPGDPAAKLSHKLLASSKIQLRPSALIVALESDNDGKASSLDLPTLPLLVEASA